MAKGKCCTCSSGHHIMLHELVNKCKHACARSQIGISICVNVSKLEVAAEHFNRASACL